MKIAVLSGKGGTGKTFLSVNLAAAAGHAVYIDCDVEEPNGRIFLKPNDVSSRDVCTFLPQFDPELCDGCRKCTEFCRFNALVYLKGKPKVFPDICHACGGCSLVCPRHAISEIPRPVGKLEHGFRGQLHVITGILNTGEASAIPVIKAVQKEGFAENLLTILDCPPGSACSAMESAAASDFCILAAEPTAFGFHNFQMVYELITLLHKPLAVIINKAGIPYPPLEQFCRDRNVPVLGRIPYSHELARLGAAGKLACEEDPRYQALFEGILQKIGGEPA